MTKTARRERSESQGFTLVELLIVIAIIAILAAIIALIINPLELIRRGRDATRLTDMSNLQNAINVAVQEATNSGTNPLCYNTTAPCSGDSSVQGRSNNGTGWVKVNFSGQPSVTIPVLPIDPINSGSFVYKYATDAQGSPAVAVNWEITAVLESQKYTPMMKNDGGDNDNAYEVGSSLTIIP